MAEIITSRISMWYPIVFTAVKGSTRLGSDPQLPTGADVVLYLAFRPKSAPEAPIGQFKQGPSESDSSGHLLRPEVTCFEIQAVISTAPQPKLPWGCPRWPLGITTLIADITWRAWYYILMDNIA
jgi:hypothetical protein